MLCYVGVGGRCESEERAGVSHFLEHLVFRGTAEYASSLELDQAFEAIGGAVNASTDTETTCYHSRLHPQRLAEGAALFASMLLRPRLCDLEVERRIILEEALEDYNERGAEINPDNLTGRLLWPGHPLSLPTIGSRASIAALDERGVRQHFDTFYTPANTVIAVAGPVQREAVRTAVAAAFADWSGVAPPGPLPWQEPLTVDPPQIAWVKDSASQVSIQLAWRVPGRNDPSSLPLRVLRRILSGSSAARLMLRLRETLALTYNVEANIALFADSGCLAVDLAVTPDNVETAVREVLGVLEGLRHEPVGELELQRVLRGYRYDLDFSRDHTDELAARYGWGTLVGCLRTLEDDRRELASVTPQLLQATAQRLFAPAQMKGAVVGPFRQRDRSKVEALLI
jgi:predicted Zn-dependent peptidase